MAATAPAIVAALVIGFLAGLFTFKRSLRWCSLCGATLRCPHCHGQAPTVRVLPR